MDKTSSYQASQQIEQGLEPSVSDIYTQAINVPSAPVRAEYEDIVSPGDVTSVTSGAGGNAKRAQGIYLFPATASEVFLSIDTILASYNPSSDDNWSVVLTISSGVFTGTVAYDATDNLYNATGSSQTRYRIPIVRSEVFVATYGAYSEKIICVNGESVVQFIHI